jgi:hypothetical protein
MFCYIDLAGYVLRLKIVHVHSGDTSVQQCHVNDVLCSKKNACIVCVANLLLLCTLC